MRTNERRRARAARRRTAGRAGAVSALLVSVSVVASSCRPEVPPEEMARSCTVGIVGDSLTLGVEPYVGAEFANRGCQVLFVNARKSRPPAEGVAVIEGLSSLGWMPDILVVALGTNDDTDEVAFGSQIDWVMELAGDRPVIWVNIDRESTEGALNHALMAAEMRHSTLWVQDWNGFADANPTLRAHDGIHLTPAGYAQRAALMAHEVTGL